MTNTLTAEQIAQGWIAYAGQSLDPLTVVEIYTPASGSEFGTAGDFDFTQPTDDDYETDPIGAVNNFITMYRTFSPDLPSPPVSGEAVAWVNPQEMRLWKTSKNRPVTLRQWQDGYCTEPLFAAPITNEPVGVTLPADLARCLLVENNQHEKHLLQWTEGRATNKLDEYINLLKQSRDRLSAAIGERG